MGGTARGAAVGSGPQALAGAAPLDPGRLHAQDVLCVPFARGRLRFSSLYKLQQEKS